jgi:hypothetical protein
VPNFANPQSLNRYAFVLNNPLKFTDPSGHETVLCDARCDEGGGAVASSTGQLTYYDVPAAQQCGSCNTPVVAEDRSQFDLAQDNSGGGCGLCGGPPTDPYVFQTPQNSDYTAPETPAWSNAYNGCYFASVCAPHAAGTLNMGIRSDVVKTIFNLTSTTLDVLAGIVSIVNPIASAELCGLTIELGCLPALAFYAAAQQVEANISWASTLAQFASDIAGGTAGYDFETNVLVVSQDTLVSAGLSALGQAQEDPLSDIIVNGSQLGYDAAGYMGNTGPWVELRILMPWAYP